MVKAVTAVITTYKRPENVVERAIKSVVKQTYPIEQVLLVNDAPEQADLASKLEQLANKYENQHVRYIAMPANGGACHARNYGAGFAEGDFIAFLDDDDEWRSDKIACMIAAMENNAEYALVYSDLLWEQCDGSFRPMVMKSGGVNTFSQILADNYIGTTSGPLLRKSAFFDAGMFDVDMPSCQDQDLWIRMLRQGQAGYINQTLTIYHYSRDSAFKGNGDRYYSGILRLFEKYDSDYRSNRFAASKAANLRALDFLITYRDIRKYVFLKKTGMKYCPISPYTIGALPYRLVGKMLSRISSHCR